MKWRVLLVKTIIVSASTDKQIIHTITAEKDEEKKIHFVIGSKHETEAGSLDLVIIINLEHQRSAVSVTGTIITQTGQNHSIKTVQNHTGKNTQSSVNLRALVFDNAVHNYQAIIGLKKGSIQAEAFQENKIIALENARITSEPTLQIEHNQVHCGHGTAISQLDQDYLIYCQMRGLPYKQAETILIEGFLSSHA